MKKILFSISFIFINTISIFGQNDNQSIVSGKHYSYYLKTPKDWIRNSDSDFERGIEVAFAPDKSSLQTGDIFIYANSSSIDTIRGQNVKTIISFDQSDFKSRHKNAIYEKQKDILTEKDSSLAVIYFLTIKSENYYEAVAYLPVPSGVVMIIMHSKLLEGRKRYLPEFEKIVKSCYYVSEIKGIWILPGK